MINALCWASALNLLCAVAGSTPHAAIQPYSNCGNFKFKFTLNVPLSLHSLGRRHFYRVTIIRKKSNEKCVIDGAILQS